MTNPEISKLTKVGGEPVASPEPAQEGESFRPQPAHVIIEREQRNGFTYIHCACGTVIGPFHKPEYAEDAFDNHTQSKELDEQEFHPAPSLERVELPPLPKPLRTSEFWDDGIERAIAGERAARLERERQLLAEMKVSAGLRKDNRKQRFRAVAAETYIAQVRAELQSLRERQEKAADADKSAPSDVQNFWKSQAFPVINAIGEISVQEAIDGIEKHFGVSHD